ncbi:MAG: response regulator [Ignavibacteriae bacterium]|nr:MAG: response regulator [Ignavibacteriota bacterium]
MIHKGDILIVDDTHASLKLLTDILTKEGFQVRPADSGELALSSVAAKLPELILLDMRMSGMDGFEVFQRLKAREESRTIPIIFLSAFTETDKRIEGLKLGAVDFVSKPFQSEELLARVQTQVELSRLRVRLEHQAIELRLANEQLQIDIRERNRAEEALKKSEEMLQSIFISTPDSITVTDLNGRITFANQSAAAIRDVSSAEHLIGKSFYELIAEEERHRAEESMKKVIKEGVVKDIEFVGLKSNNERFVGELSVSVLKDSSGRINGFVGIAKDITVRKRMEETLAATSEEREKLIHELQYALENIKTLEGLLPICSNCKKIRDDQGFWNQVEGYISKHTDAKFSHGICPDCSMKLYGDLYARVIEEQKKEII